MPNEDERIVLPGSKETAIQALVAKWRKCVRLELGRRKPGDSSRTLESNSARGLDVQEPRHLRWSNGRKHVGLEILVPTPHSFFSLPSSCFTCPGKERKEVVSSTVFRVGMILVEESKRNDENRKV